MLTSLLLAVSDPEQPEPSESTPREVRENTGDVVDGGPASPSNVSLLGKALQYRQRWGDAECS